jgi:2-haloacid dehalogenase
MLRAPIAALTFDCYGTLIDWETGILRAFSGLLGPSLVQSRRDELIRAYARHEREVESGPYLPYRDVLAEVSRRIARDFGLPPRMGDEQTLAESIRDWPAFDETPGALRAFKSRFRLAVLSNIDDDLFEGSRPRLGVELNELVTAQRVRSYKPGRAHFDEALRRLAIKPSQILHVAESRYHDIAPAAALGFRTVWVNRRGPNPSASGEADAKPDLEVPDLATLVRVLEKS